MSRRFGVLILCIVVLIGGGWMSAAFKSDSTPETREWIGWIVPLVLLVLVLAVRHRPAHREAALRSRDIFGVVEVSPAKAVLIRVGSYVTALILTVVSVWFTGKAGESIPNGLRSVISPAVIMFSMIGVIVITSRFRARRNDLDNKPH